MAQPSPDLQVRQPPSAVRELHANFLRTALERFFPTASLQRQALCGELREDPRCDFSADRTRLVIDWLDSRYRLVIPPDRRFTDDELRLASAIALVLSSRYRAVRDPHLMADKGDLFRGAIEDRFVGAFLDPRPYLPDAPPSLHDRIAPALEVLRVAAVSSYENRTIATGLLLLGDDSPTRLLHRRARSETPYWDLLPSAKGMFRLADGVHSLFLVDAHDSLLDVIDIERWATETASGGLPVACARAYVPHALATMDNRNVCVVLSPSHEMKVFAGGIQVFAFRNANWQLLDLAARFQRWASSVGSRALADRLFRTALDLADARRGALFVVLRDPAQSARQLLAVADRLDVDVRIDGSGALASRRQVLRLLAGRSVVDLDASVLCALAAIDGAIVTDSAGLLLAAGAILRHPPDENDQAWIAEGARTTAAMAASRFGPVLKVSEDGVITLFDRQEVWEI